MGFRKDAYAKVWKIDDKGKYSIGQISISKKNKETGQYEVEFQDGFVRFVGDAHEAIKDVQIPEKGVSIKITSCDVTNKYVKEKKMTYTNYVVFGLEFPDGNTTTTKKSSGKSSKKSAKAKDDDPDFAELDDDDDDLPF